MRTDADFLRCPHGWTRARLDKLWDEAKEKNELADLRLQRTKPLLTRDEFNLLLNCLHPDRAPADRRERFDQGFAIFKRLERLAR